MEKNWDKLVLAVAGVALLACLYFAFRIFSASPGSPPQPGRGDNLPPSLVEPIHQALTSLANQHEWKSPKLPSGADLDLFVSRAVIVPKSNSEVTIVMDDEGSTPLQDPIPNGWWLEHDIAYLADNAKELDPDGDGFSNLEEWEGESDPNDRESHPDVTDKLALNSIETSVRMFEFHMNQGNSVGMREMVQTGTARPTRLWAKSVEVGGLAGPARPEDQSIRYRLASVSGEGADAKLTVEDTQAAEGSRNARFELPFRELTSINDYTAVFDYTLDRPGGEKIEVPEGGEFSLPGVDDASYRLVSVDPDAKTALIEVRSGEGEVRQLTIGRNGPQ